jgi:bleomycin hydrolase
MPQQVTSDLVDRLNKEFRSDPSRVLLQNAVTKTQVTDIALRRDVVTETDHSVSHLLDDWKVTDQQQSGRCWLFAGLNLLRFGARERLEVKDFEFSQNYLLFWDKFEKANHWLEAILATSRHGIDDRTVAHLLANPADDGGQWNMFVALVEKYGLVPKSAMPETASSCKTGRMNANLGRLLRQAARDLRASAAAGDDDDSLESQKEGVLTVVHRLLSTHLGTPPERFMWQWADKDKGFHRDGETTPQEFAQRYVTVPIGDYVCVVHDPRESSPIGRTFTVEYLGNVVGAPPVVYLNVETDLMKKLAQDVIVGGEPVWFGCDVDQMMEHDLGIWDASLYDFDALYGSTDTLTKADRLLTGESLMTHAMLFTGVDIVDGAPRRWRVENSWGDKKGDQGFHTMNDNWFAEYVFEIAVRRSLLPPELQAALDGEPIVLPAWDPMGALAR